MYVYYEQPKHYFCIETLEQISNAKTSCSQNTKHFSDNVPLRNMCKVSSSASVTTFIPDRGRVCYFMRQQNNNDARNVKKTSRFISKLRKNIFNCISDLLSCGLGQCI